jgi:hypothetical protein
MARKKKASVDVGDEKQVQGHETRTQLAREREIYELRELLGTYGGRAFVWRMLVECKMYRAPAIHPQEGFVDIGQQNVGRWLTNEVFTSDPEAYTLMWREAQEREKNG